jgi:hypothetical protein
MFFRLKFNDIVHKTFSIIFIYIEKNKLMLSIFTIVMFKDFHNFIITAFHNNIKNKLLGHCTVSQIVFFSLACFSFHLQRHLPYLPCLRLLW